jgi:hypothetical protein
MKFPKLEDESLEWTYQGNTTRKGLKCLAELLLKILGKKSLQQAEIVSLIEGILCKGKHEVEIVLFRKAERKKRTSNEGSMMP